MNEAAASALESLRNQDCSPGIGSELEVQVRTAVTHSIAINKLQDWAGLGGGSPKEVILKRRMVMPSALRRNRRESRGSDAEQRLLSG